MVFNSFHSVLDQCPIVRPLDCFMFFIINNIVGNIVFAAICGCLKLLF